MGLAIKITRSQAIKDLTSAGRPFELTKMEVFGATCLVFKNAPLTLRQLFENSRSDAEFYIYEKSVIHSNKSISFHARLPDY